MQHYCMEKMALCASVNHIFQTDLQMDQISCVKDFISVHMQTIALKYIQKYYDKNMVWFEN